MRWRRFVAVVATASVTGTLLSVASPLQAAAQDCTIASGSYVTVHWTYGPAIPPYYWQVENFVTTWGNVYTSGRCTGELSILAVPQYGEETFIPGRCQPDPDINATVGGCQDPPTDPQYVGVYPSQDFVVSTAYYNVDLIGADGSVIDRNLGECFGYAGSFTTGTSTGSIPQ